MPSLMLDVQHPLPDHLRHRCDQRVSIAGAVEQAQHLAIGFVKQHRFMAQVGERAVAFDLQRLKQI